MDKRIFILCRYITENIQQEFSTKFLAQKVNLSPSHLSGLFKQETGLSPIRYIINLRLRAARNILETEDFLSVKQIASEVGFNDQNHFIREFKTKYGITPKKYRDIKWEKEENELMRSN